MALRRVEVLRNGKWETVKSLANVRAGETFRMFESEGVAAVDSRDGVTTEWVATEDGIIDANGFPVILSEVKPLDVEDPTCDACGYSSPDLVVQHYKSSPDGRSSNNDGKNLCDLCAGTFAGNAFDYPAQYPYSDIMFMVSYVGNAIIEEIRKK